jgi:hypothetical protein
MSKISWRQVSALALAAFFVVGSLSNIFAPGSIYEEYLRWGYPPWFHFVTGSLELTTAVLLAQARTRLWGSALGCTVMLAALATVTLHGEYGHGVPPLIVATLSIVVGWIAWRASPDAVHDPGRLSLSRSIEQLPATLSPRLESGRVAETTQA